MSNVQFGPLTQIQSQISDLQKTTDKGLARSVDYKLDKARGLEKIGRVLLNLVHIVAQKIYNVLPGNKGTDLKAIKEKFKVIAKEIDENPEDVGSLHEAIKLCEHLKEKYISKKDNTNYEFFDKATSELKELEVLLSEVKKHEETSDKQEKTSDKQKKIEGNQSHRNDSPGKISSKTKDELGKQLPYAKRTPTEAQKHEANVADALAHSTTAEDLQKHVDKLKYQQENPTPAEAPKTPPKPSIHSMETRSSSKKVGEPTSLSVSSKTRKDIQKEIGRRTPSPAPAPVPASPPKSATGEAVRAATATRIAEKKAKQAAAKTKLAGQLHKVVDALLSANAKIAGSRTSGRGTTPTPVKKGGLTADDQAKLEGVKGKINETSVTTLNNQDVLDALKSVEHITGAFHKDKQVKAAIKELHIQQKSFEQLIEE